MAKTSIFFFTTTLHIGGAERVVLNLMELLRDAGYEITLVLVRAEGEYLPLVPDGIEVISLDARKSIWALSGLTRVLRRRRPQILFAHMVRNALVGIAAKRLARSDTKIVACLHAPISRVTAGITWVNHLLPLIAPRILPYADAIAAVSHGIADDLARISSIRRQDIDVVYNPVITPDFKRRSEAEIDHPWFKDRSVPILVGVGRLSPQKDFSTLLRAFQLVRQARPARLILIGDGEERGLLERLASELGAQSDIVFRGAVQNALPYVRHASLLVMSSRVEGLPTVLIEGLGCGTPIVSTDCISGPSEILERGKLGRLVPVGDHHALAGAILEALQSAPAPETLIASASRFTADAAIAGYRAIFDRVLDRPAA